MGASGQTILDLGPFPGVSDTEFTLTGLTGIADDSEVEAWIEPADTTAGLNAGMLFYQRRVSGLSIGTPITASKLGILSVWVRPEDPQGATTPFMILMTGGATNYVELTLNPLRIRCRNAAGTNIDVDLVASLELPLGNNLLHILAAWDVGTNVGSLYVNDVLYDNAINRVADENLGYASINTVNIGSDVATNDFKGCIGEVYFAGGQYLDLSITANRRKFISASGAPVDLGATGATPTGSQPHIYMHMGDHTSSSGFLTNAGSSGGTAGYSDVSGAGVGFKPPIGIPIVSQPSHTLDEHVIDPPNCRGYSANAAGSSMKIRLSARDGIPNQGLVNLNAPLIFGKWNVGYAWN